MSVQRRPSVQEVFEWAMEVSVGCADLDAVQSIVVRADKDPALLADAVALAIRVRFRSPQALFEDRCVVLLRRAYDAAKPSYVA